MTHATATSTDTPVTRAIATLLRDLDIPHELSAPLAPLTWYGVGGAASALAHPRNIPQLTALFSRCHADRIPIYVLGSGANLLVADEGVQGIVVRLDHKSFKEVSYQDDDSKIVTVGAGCDLAQLINETARKGLAGLDVLAGVPASIGGAVRMNAGGSFGSIGPLVRRIQVMQHDGSTLWLDRSQLIFAYRSTNITAPMVLTVELELTPGDSQALRQRVLEIMDYKKRVQPMADHSAGCAFKNPADAPLDPTTNKPISAGKLIDMAGLKGYRIGNAMISPQHANFVVALRGQVVRSADLLACIGHAQRVVKEKFNITLHREVVIWPDPTT